MHSVEPTGEVPRQAGGSLLHALDLVGVLADVARSWEAADSDLTVTVTGTPRGASIVGPR